MGKFNKYRAQKSSDAIEQLPVSTKHLFNRGFYKPMGISGENCKTFYRSKRVMRP